MTASELIDFITDNPKGTKLPEPPVIRGDLDLIGESITWLPDDLIVTGNMCILNCPNLKVLPANMFVGGCLTLTGSNIRSIPADLCVCGSIWAKDMDLDIPAGFTANCDLYLGSSSDSQGPCMPPLRLPDNLTVNGLLDVANRYIEWPRNLFIKGRLVFGPRANGDRNLK